jgi:hypothetical protein
MASGSTLPNSLPPSVRLRHLWPIADQIEHAARQQQRSPETADTKLPVWKTRPAEIGRPLWEWDADGTIWLNLHAGQQRAWESDRRFVLVLAGLQSGKTSYGPWWLAEQIRQLGQGDYIAATATYDLFKLKMLPALRECFETALGWGRYWSGDRIIELADPHTGQFWATRDYIADEHGAPGHLVPRFALDPKWQRYMGLDFGGVNTAALFYAEEPGTKRLFLYREYHAGSRTAKEHAVAMLDGEPMVPFCVGGSKRRASGGASFAWPGCP